MQTNHNTLSIPKNLIQVAHWLDGLTYFMLTTALHSDEKLVYVIDSSEDGNEPPGFAIYDINTANFIGKSGLTLEKATKAKEFIEFGKDDFLEYLQRELNAH